MEKKKRTIADIERDIAFVKADICKLSKMGGGMRMLIAFEDLEELEEELERRKEHHA